MGAYLVRRFLLMVLTLFGMSVLIFVMLRLVPGNIADILVDAAGIADAKEKAKITHELGLDQPIIVQYGVFLAHIARGDFGRSIHFREPAMKVVAGYLPASLQLALTAFVIAALIAVPIGLLSAIRRNTLIDHVTMAVALVGQSAPTFFLGIFFILTLSLGLGWFPTSGRGSWDHLVLPALTLGAF